MLVHSASVEALCLRYLPFDPYPSEFLGKLWSNNVTVKVGRCPKISRGFSRRTILGVTQLRKGSRPGFSASLFGPGEPGIAQPYC